QRGMRRTAKAAKATSSSFGAAQPKAPRLAMHQAIAGFISQLPELARATLVVTTSATWRTTSKANKASLPAPTRFKLIADNPVIPGSPARYRAERRSIKIGLKNPLILRRF